MATAETARLFTSLELTDKFTPGIKRANAALGGFERNTTQATTRVSRGFSNAGRSMGGFVKQGLALAGIGLGVGAVVGELKSAVSAATDMAKATRDFSAVTGLGVQESSKWVDVLGKFGLEGNAATTTFARLQKNSLAYAAAQTKARAALDKQFKGRLEEDTAAKLGGKALQAWTGFQQKFGLSVTGANGKLVSANELLKRSADFFNSNATAAEKATTLQKLYGKSWTQLIPLFKLGRKGIEDEFGSALELTPKQIKAMQDLLEVQKDFNDAWGDVQVTIGVALIPTITKAVRGLASFLDQNREGIGKFAEGLAHGAEVFAGAIGGLLPLARTIADAWNAIPDDFKKLLIGGVVANKVLKMTIGFDPLDIGRKAITGIFARGGSPATPMFTKEVGLPGIGGGGGTGLPGVGGGLGRTIAGTAITGLSVGAAGLGIVEAIDTWGKVNQRSTEQATDVQKSANQWLSRMPSQSDLQSGLAAVDQGLAEIRSNPLNVLVQGDAITKLEQIRAGIQAQIAVLSNLPTTSFVPVGVFAPGQGVQRRPGGKDQLVVDRGRREGQNRGSNVTPVNLNVNVSHRQTDTAAQHTTRYTPVRPK